MKIKLKYIKDFRYILHPYEYRFKVCFNDEIINWFEKTYTRVEISWHSNLYEHKCNTNNRHMRWLRKRRSEVYIDIKDDEKALEFILTCL